MPHNLDRWVLDVMEAMGYAGLAFLMLLENLFPPIPSEVVLPLAGFLVGRNDLSFFGALAASTLGSVAGALLLYALGRWGGRNLVLRYGHLLRLKESQLERVESWFRRYGDAVVLLGRLLPLTRSVVSIPAGIAKMPVLRFVAFTAIGSAIWNALLVGSGAILVANWSLVTDAVGRIADTVAILALVSAAGTGIWWLLRRQRRTGREAGAQDTDKYS